MLKTINQTLVFLIELAMLASLSYFGFQKGNGPITKYGYAIIFPVAVVVLWAYCAAPKSQHRLAMPYLAIFRLTSFLLASYLLYRSGQTSSAVILALLSVATQVISLFVEGGKMKGS